MYRLHGLAGRSILLGPRENMLYSTCVVQRWANSTTARVWSASSLEEFTSASVDQDKELANARGLRVTQVHI